MDALAIVFTGHHELELAREEMPEPGSGQVLVRTRCSLISTGTECICLTRHFESGTHWDAWVQYPFYPGYSNIGEVVAVGEGVRRPQPGERVATRAGHRQYHLAAADGMLTVPASLSDEEAAWFALATIVQNGVRRAEHELGDAVVVIGLGLLGQLVVQYARLQGARQVIAVDVAERRLQLAGQHGATATVPLAVEEAADAIFELTERHGADVVYDVTGHPAVFPHALRLARRFGKVVLLGDTGFPGQQRLTVDVVTRGLRIIGAHDSNPPATASDHLYWSWPNMARLFFTYLQRGDLRVRDLITHRFAPGQARAAYDLLLHRRAEALGVVFDWASVE